MPLVAAVTGASSGIGAATARRLARDHLDARAGIPQLAKDTPHLAGTVKFG